MELDKCILIEGCHGCQGIPTFWQDWHPVALFSLPAARLSNHDSPSWLDVIDDDTCFGRRKEPLDTVRRGRRLAEPEMGLQRATAAVARARVDLPGAHQGRAAVNRHHRADPVGIALGADRLDTQPALVV